MPRWNGCRVQLLRLGHYRVQLASGIGDRSRQRLRREGWELFEIPSRSGHLDRYHGDSPTSGLFASHSHLRIRPGEKRKRGIRRRWNDGRGTGHRHDGDGPLPGRLSRGLRHRRRLEQRQDEPLSPGSCELYVSDKPAGSKRRERELLVRGSEDFQMKLLAAIKFAAQAAWLKLQGQAIPKD